LRIGNTGFSSLFWKQRRGTRKFIKVAGSLRHADEQPMTRDEAIATAQDHAIANGWRWTPPVSAGREWVWLRFWFRWVVTAPAPAQPGSIVITINASSGAVENVFFVGHVFDWLRRVRNPSFLDFQPTPLWFQFLTAPLTLVVTLLSVAIDYFFAIRDWVVELSKPRCPRCGARLRTSIAQQCPKCHLSWHGAPRPER
jgi:hypothetical protein